MVDNVLKVKFGINVTADDPADLFQLRERIGKGSYGSVYKGQRASLTLILYTSVM
jgi:hypothetical protein